MDGEVVIGVGLDVKELERGLKVAEKKLNELDKERDKLNQQKAKVDIDLQAYENEKKEIEETYQEDLKLVSTEEQKKELLKQRNISLNELNAKYSEQIQNSSQINQKLQENADLQERVKNEIAETNQQIARTESYEDVKNAIDNIGNSVKKVTSKVVKWGLALFGIRGAYSMISRSMSTIRQYDKQLDADLRYIEFALAYTLKPIIDEIVKLVMQLLTYINYIANVWFGVNIFKNSGIQQYENAIKNSSKSAEKINKELSTFDEANVLGSNASAGGTGGGFVAPSTDLSKIGGDIPEWVKWIGEHKDEILAVAEALTGLFLLIKGIDFASKLAPLLNLFGNGGAGASTGSSGILGKIGLIAGSLAVINWSIAETKRKWDELSTTTDTIIANGTKNTEEWAKKQTELNTLQDELYKKRERVNDTMINFNLLTNNALKGTYTLQKGIQEYGKDMKGNLVSQFKIVEQQHELYKSGKMTNEEQKLYKKYLLEQYRYHNDIEMKLYNEGIDTKSLTIISGRYKDMLSEIGVEFKTNNNLISEAGTEWEKYSNKAQRNKDSINNNVVNPIQKAIDNVKELNKLPLIDKYIKIKTDTSSLKELIRKLPNTLNLGLGMSLNLSGIKKGLGLAKGGIINNPGRGVSLGNGIIGGEAGREMVLPLDDNTLDRLGSAIARHQVINATIVNQMNGRTLSREIKQITNENGFSYNV